MKKNKMALVTGIFGIIFSLLQIAASVILLVPVFMKAKIFLPISANEFINANASGVTHGNINVLSGGGFRNNINSAIMANAGGFSSSNNQIGTSTNLIGANAGYQAVKPFGLYQDAMNGLDKITKWFFDMIGYYFVIALFVVLLLSILYFLMSILAIINYRNGEKGKVSLIFILILNILMPNPIMIIFAIVALALSGSDGTPKPKKEKPSKDDGDKADDKKEETKTEPAPAPAPTPAPAAPTPPPAPVAPAPAPAPTPAPAPAPQYQQPAADPNGGMY
jgi:hypothetical protein